VYFYELKIDTNKSQAIKSAMCIKCFRFVAAVANKTLCLYVSHQHKVVNFTPKTGSKQRSDETTPNGMLLSGLLRFEGMPRRTGRNTAVYCGFAVVIL